MKKYLEVFLLSLKHNLMREMEYRGDFVFIILHIGIFLAFNIIFYKAIYMNVSSIGGWSFNQILVLMGTYIILDSIFFSFLVGNLGSIDTLVRKGELDKFLLKPLDSQFLVSIDKIKFTEMPSFIAGIIVVSYALSQAKISVTILTILGYIFFILCSFVIMYSLGMILSCLVFFIDKAEEMHEVTISFLQFAKYPDMYRGFIKIVFMSLVPIVFVAYVPASIITARANTTFILYYLVITILFIVGSRMFWKYALSKYKSAGG